ncbi:NAD(P)-binding protein [Xylariaceae sp. AK1471]|nr:NAD(P)-binding protein [Xylariaceae sp. AK1471]
MSTLKKVAIAGSTGNLGPAILQQVVEAGFDVTVLTRQRASHSFPPSVKVAEVNYESLESLTNALRGQDAVVSTIASAALAKQLLLVEAAAKAGVKRFLPSEFGSNTVHPKTSQLPSYGDKVAVQTALKKEAQTGGMTYTLVLNGPFFDWGMRVGFVADVKGRNITLWDGGERVFSTTTLATIGRAVVGVLKHPEETKNRAVYVQDTALSSKQLLEIGKRATGDDWKANTVSLDDHVNNGWEELHKPQPDPAKFVMNFITASIWGEGYGSRFEKLDNELLGIKEMNEADIEALIRGLGK